MSNKLSPDQETVVLQCLQRYFDIMSCIDPVQHAVAEKSAVDFLIACGLPAPSKTQWVAVPVQGDLLYREVQDPLKKNLDVHLEKAGYSWSGIMRTTSRRALGIPLWRQLKRLCTPKFRDYTLDLEDSAELPDCYSFMDVLTDAESTCFDDITRQMGVVYPPQLELLLSCRIKLLQSCFAAWLIPDAIILCERPSGVTRTDTSLIRFWWEHSEE